MPFVPDTFSGTPERVTGAGSQANIASNVYHGGGLNLDYYYNPANDWNEGNYATAIFKGYGLVGGVVLTALAAPVTLAYGGASATVIGLAAAGSAAGLAGGAISTFAYNPNAGMHEYAFNMGFGSLIGGFNPAASFGSLGGGAIGAGGAWLTGNNVRAGYQIGDLAGGIAAGGIMDARKVFLKAGNLRGAIGHGLRFAAVEGGVTTAGGAYGYAHTGTLEGALFYANIGSMAGGLAASRFVKCFVAGTEVVVPISEVPLVDPAGTRLAARLIVPATPLGNGSDQWRRWAAGMGVIGAGIVGWSAAQAVRRKQSIETYSKQSFAQAVDQILGTARDLLDPPRPERLLATGTSHQATRADVDDFWKNYG